VLQNRVGSDTLLILFGLHSTPVSRMYWRDVPRGSADRTPLWRNPGLDAQRIIYLPSVMVFPKPTSASGVSVLGRSPAPTVRDDKPVPQI
jgi:hypothetical protein